MTKQEIGVEYHHFSTPLALPKAFSQNKDTEHTEPPPIITGGILVNEIIPAPVSCSLKKKVQPGDGMKPLQWNSAILSRYAPILALRKIGKREGGIYFNIAFHSGKLKTVSLGTTNQYVCYVGATKKEAQARLDYLEVLVQQALLEKLGFNIEDTLGERFFVKGGSRFFNFWELIEFL